ncbi:hypothetical protein PGT21_020205 [Puccinia graminis f. sp. tritici]|uniref:Uncharacterized protein n=1 Tax=Puccinia graminis f. sp. tritici TaxID=56615 RepID=A0A5B0Q3Z0_PUCGR|nr:hypothetical protein PGT21_020205 [Puccinia graminis f. sp. tritici]KAA1124579.1 hypothetical protein PGTUg99_018641 [Puccinia graminis f. sp. tritici]
MSNLQRRLAGEDINLSTIPPGVNPFNHVTNIITPRYFIPLSISATAFLVVFFIFHLLISIFCLVLLLLPYFRDFKQSQWLFRKLYIKDNSGTNVYNTPLYWVNAGILMTASQLIGSLGAQAFILIQILSADSVRYAIHSQLEPPLGLMFIGEMLTYWSLMHCFLVAIYYDNKTHGDPTKHVTRWSPSPTLINSVFLGFPICIVAATIALFTWLCSAHKLFSTGAGQILDSLKQGSSVWDRLRVSSTESEEELQLTTQLLEITTQITNLRQETSVHLDHVVHCFLILQSVLLVLLWITCLIFISMFWLLVSKYQKSNVSSGSASANTSFFRRWLWPKISRGAIEEQTVSTTPSLYDMAKKDRQFFHLLVRSLGMIIAMMTMMVLFLLGIVRTVDVVRSPYWRGVAAWLATASGTWSAFPITWQCWRLYKEELSGGSNDSANKNSSCKMDATHQDSVPPRPWDTDSTDIEIKFISPATSASPVSHEP